MIECLPAEWSVAQSVLSPHDRPGAGPAAAVSAPARLTDAAGWPALLAGAGFAVLTGLLPPRIANAASHRLLLLLMGLAAPREDANRGVQRSTVQATCRAVPRHARACPAICLVPS